MTYVVGVDEAGRGPLAGPVAVGIICAPESFDILGTFPGLNDSKQLSEKARERIYVQLEAGAGGEELRHAVIFRDAQDIDERGIAVVIREAVAEGVQELLPDSSIGTVYLDGSLKAPETYMQETIVRGDSLIPAIMLASVAAKVSRDRLMRVLANTYPQYEFERHKGYGTALHMARIKEHGPCAIHRRSFLKGLTS